MLALRHTTTQFSIMGNRSAAFGSRVNAIAMAVLTAVVLTVLVLHH
jgi:hypothetical protein